MVTETSVAAGAVASLFSGFAYEIAQGARTFTLACVASATGAFLTISSGPDLVSEEHAPMVLTTMPIYPDHFYYNDKEKGSEKLVLRFRNPTGGAITARAIAILSAP